MRFLVAKHFKFYSCWANWNKRFIKYLSYISLIGHAPTIWITSFLRFLEREMLDLKFQLYLFIEIRKHLHDSLLNGCKTSNVWLPNMSHLHPIRTCFFLTCPSLGKNNGILTRKIEPLHCLYNKTYLSLFVSCYFTKLWPE